MISYFYPELKNSKNKPSRFVNELVKPSNDTQDVVYKQQCDVIEKNNSKLLTNDGREMLSEQKK